MKRARTAQGGFALVMLLAIVTMGSLALFLGHLSPVMQEAQRRHKTEFALQQARDALLGYMLRYRDLQAMQDANATGDDDRSVYGFLPLPDLGSTRNINAACLLEGCEANTPTGIGYDANGLLPTLVGRFPWRSLGTEPLADGNGECLWLMVSSLHLRNRLSVTGGPPLNWDTLGQLDLVTADGSANLQRLLSRDGNQLLTPDQRADLRAHERPVAIIFSPGTVLSGQDRSPSATDDVSACGGNYDARNYLDPASAATLAGVSNYLGGTNNASGLTGDSDRSNDPDTPKAIATNGALLKTAGGLFRAGGCYDSDCTLLGNDLALPLRADELFGRLRNLSSFRTDTNALLGRMNSCLRDRIASGNDRGLASLVPVNATCYGDDVAPMGYFSHYQEQVLLASAAAGTYTVNGQTCAGALILAGQRGSGQRRRTVAERNSFAANYLEGINSSNFGLGTEFSGPSVFARASVTQTAAQDIVQCIPTGASFQSPQSAGLTAAGRAQLAQYNSSTGTLTLGVANPAAYPGTLANALFGCAWQSDAHALSSGLSAYFKFRINDAGFSGAPAQGMNFALVDADNNGIGACGGAAQHLGFSGRNRSSAGVSTPHIAPPKIGFEIDPSRDFVAPTGFNSAAANTLTNGRNDPAVTAATYRGGHVGVVYWGSENTLATATPCTWPRITVAGVCVLPDDQDDNVHNQLAGAGSTRAGYPAPPVNPAAPASPTIGSGLYKLDPNVASVPTNQDFHVRVEVSRGPLRLASVRAASVGNVALAAPGASIDGVTLALNERLLLKNQTTASQNGVYLWQGASAALVRPGDADATGEREGTLIEVVAGTINAATAWRNTASNTWTRIDGQGAAAGRWLSGADALPTSGLLAARLASTIPLDLSAGVNVAAPYTRIDNVVIGLDDRIVLKNQSNPAENGLYVVTDLGAASNPRYRLQRSSDADTPAELAGVVVEISQGATQAGSVWRQSVSVLTLGTTPLYWGNIRVKVADSAATPVNPDNPVAPSTWPVMAVGDRVLIRGYATKRGVFLWNGPGVAMSRASDAATAAQRSGLAVQVQQGDDATGWWLSDAGDNWVRQVAVVASLLPLNLAAPGGNVIDGIALAVNDKVLVRAQTLPAENGIYVWTGSALVRDTAYDSPGELAGAIIQVTQGSAAGRSFRQSALPASVGTDPVRWDAIDNDTHYRINVWLLPDSVTNANQIAAMKNTTRPMSQLYPGLPAHVAAQSVIGYPFRNARLGFTIGQATTVTDQTFLLSDFSSTWLP